MSGWADEGSIARRIDSKQAQQLSLVVAQAGPKTSMPASFLSSGRDSGTVPALNMLLQAGPGGRAAGSSEIATIKSAEGGEMTAKIRTARWQG